MPHVAGHQQGFQVITPSSLPANISPLGGSPVATTGLTPQAGSPLGATAPGGFDQRTIDFFTQLQAAGPARATQFLGGVASQNAAANTAAFQNAVNQGKFGQNQLLDAFVNQGLGTRGETLIDGQVAPQTGVIGSEFILNQASQDQIDALNAALASAETTIAGFAEGAGGVLDESLQSALSQLTAGQQDLRQSQEQALGAIQQSIGQGAQGFQPFLEQGQQAGQLQAAQSGALGPEAQRQALQNFIEGPEQQFLREQGRRQILASAAATGGLGGGDVQRELTRFGTGLAAQDFQNQFNRIGQVAGQGLQAATGRGSLFGQQAGLQAGTIGQAAGARAGLTGQGAGLTGQIGGAGANLLARTGETLGNLALTGGLTTADILGGTAGTIAQGRLLTGLNFADVLQGTTGAQADLLSQQGAGVADITGAAGANLATIFESLGAQTAADKLNILQILSNLAIQQGGQLANQPSPAQFLGGGGILNDLASLLSGAGTAALGFDALQPPPPVDLVSPAG